MVFQSHGRFSVSADVDKKVSFTRRSKKLTVLFIIFFFYLKGPVNLLVLGANAVQKVTI